MRFFWISVSLIVFTAMVAAPHAASAQTYTCPGSSVSETNTTDRAVGANTRIRTIGCNSGGGGSGYYTFTVFSTATAGRLRMSFLGFGGGSTTESFSCTGATTTGTSGGAQFDPAVSTLSCTASTVAGGFSHDLAFDAGFRTSADTTGTNNFSASVTNLRMVVSNRTPAPVLSGLVATVGLADDQVTIEFGEPVGFALSDLTLSNLPADNLQPSGTTAYTFDVEPTVDGAGSMSLAANTVTDAGNTAATAVTTTAIASRPEVSFESIFSVGATNTYRFRYTIPGGDELMINTAVALSSNFGFTITNGTFVRAEIEGTDGLVDTIITPTGGDIIISFATGLVIDRASGNLSAAGGPFDVGNGDMTPPNGTLLALPTTVGMGERP